MTEKNSHGPENQKVERVEFLILLAFLVLVLLALDKSSAVDFLKILTIYLISARIMKRDFSHIIPILSKDGKNRLYEYILSAIFTFFIFIEVEFLLNKFFIYALFAFSCLLIFTIGIFYFVAGNQNYEAYYGRK